MDLRRGRAVDELAGDKVGGNQLGADGQDGIGSDLELDELALRLNTGLGEMTQHRHGDILGSAIRASDLESCVSVSFLVQHLDNLALLKLFGVHSTREGERRQRFQVLVLLFLMMMGSSGLSRCWSIFVSAPKRFLFIEQLQIALPLSRGMSIQS